MSDLSWQEDLAMSNDIVIIENLGGVCYVSHCPYAPVQVVRVIVVDHDSQTAALHTGHKTGQCVQDLDYDILTRAQRSKDYSSDNDAWIDEALATNNNNYNNNGDW